MVQANPVLVVANATNPKSWKILALPTSHGFGRTKQPCLWRVRNAARFSARDLCIGRLSYGQVVADLRRRWTMLTVPTEVVVTGPTAGGLSVTVNESILKSSHRSRGFFAIFGHHHLLRPRNIKLHVAGYRRVIKKRSGHEAGPFSILRPGPHASRFHETLKRSMQGSR